MDAVVGLTLSEGPARLIPREFHNSTLGKPLHIISVGILVQIMFCRMFGLTMMAADQTASL
jgi:hypothetical protein